MSLDLLPLHTVAIILVVLFPLSSLAFPYENKCLAVDYENGGKYLGKLIPPYFILLVLNLKWVFFIIPPLQMPH